MRRSCLGGDRFFGCRTVSEYLPAPSTAIITTRIFSLALNRAIMVQLPGAP